MQLRWLVVNNPDGGRCSRLQYRLRDRHLDYGFVDDEEHWSEWQDVPEVNEVVKWG